VGESNDIGHLIRPRRPDDGWGWLADDRSPVSGRRLAGTDAPINRHPRGTQQVLQ